MASLNRYRDYFDPSTKDGMVMYNAALVDYKSSLEKKICLESLHASTVKSTFKRVSNLFGWDLIMSNVPTTKTETPGADEGDHPVVVTYTSPINLLETHS